MQGLVCILEGSMITLNATAAYCLISDDSGKINCDRIVHGDSNNNIGESSSS